MRVWISVTRSRIRGSGRLPVATAVEATYREPRTHHATSQWKFEPLDARTGVRALRRVSSCGGTERGPRRSLSNQSAGVDGHGGHIRLEARAKAVAGGRSNIRH